MSADLIIAGARIVGATGDPRRGWVHVAGGRIAEVGHGDPPRPAAHDLGGGFLAPGFIDLHVHGADGAEFLGATAEEIRRILRFHARHGTTGLLATTVTAAPERLLDTVRALAATTPDADGAAVLGLHLEGPFLNRERRGAQDPRHIRDPDPVELNRLLQAGRGATRIVTLAPELPGAIEAVRRVVAAGAIAAVGHSDATYEQATAALDAGATHATHLFNGMRAFHHREPGIVGAVLERHAVTCELICDGMHVHPAAMRLAHALKGADRLALVTDAMQATGLGDGDYRIGDLPVRVHAGRAELRDNGSLAGSTLTMAAAVRNAVNLMGVSLPEAVRMASTTAAAVIGLTGRKGAIAPGHDADLVVLDDDLHPTGVMIAGRWVAHPRVVAPQGR